MVNKIQDIAPMLAVHYLDLDIAPETKEKYLQFLNDNAKRIGIFHKYLPLLHDSLIKKIKLTKKNFSILLNEFSTHTFADAINSKKGLNIVHSKLFFPLQIDFEISDLTYNSVNHKGIIKSVEYTKTNDYLNEQFFHIDDEYIDLGLVLWKDHKNKPGEKILVLLKAKNITVTEYQAKAWNEIFGNAYNDYYNYFKSQLETGRYLSDQTSCMELVDEFDNLKSR